MSGNSSFNPKNVDIIKGIQLFAELNQGKTSSRYLLEYLLDSWVVNSTQSRSRNHTRRPGIHRHKPPSEQWQQLKRQEPSK